MSHEITARDHLVLVGAPAWHGLGVQVSPDTPVREACRQVMPWDVETRPIYTGPHYTPVPQGQAVVRIDPDGVESPLAVVGPDFVPYRNGDLIDLAEVAERASLGEARVETVGTMRGGRSVFVLLRTGSYGVGLASGDETRTYLALLNSHDGTRKVRGFDTNVRVVCANTEASAAGEADQAGRGFEFAHRASLSENMDGVRGALAAGQLWSNKRAQEDRALAGRSLTTDILGTLFGDIYTDAIGAWDADPDPLARAKAEAKARRTVAAWVEEFEHERQALVPGTAYAALQSVTRWADHGRKRVRDVAQDRLLGRGASIKLTAREHALALI